MYMEWQCTELQTPGYVHKSMWIYPTTTISTGAWQLPKPFGEYEGRLLFITTSSLMFWRSCSYLETNSCFSSNRLQSDLTYKEQKWHVCFHIFVPNEHWRESILRRCTSTAFCSNSSSLCRSLSLTSLISVSQSFLCCLMIRSIWVISSWSSGSQAESRGLETHVETPHHLTTPPSHPPHHLTPSPSHLPHPLTVSPPHHFTHHSANPVHVRSDCTSGRCWAEKAGGPPCPWR